MTDEFKKWLTEDILSECYHKAIRQQYCDGEFSARYCERCGEVCRSERDENGNRTFTEWADYGAVITALREHCCIYLELWKSRKFNMVETFIDKDLFFTTLQEFFEKEIKK